MLNIFHYLRTFKCKPGALSQSSALLQADAKIKTIYETYYTTTPKDFLYVLELINEIGVDAVEKALETLYQKSQHDLTADKLRIIHDHIVEQNDVTKTVKEDHLSIKSKSTLSQYDRLRDLQTRMAV